MFSYKNKTIAFLILLLFLGYGASSQSRHNLSVSFTPAITGVEINNFLDIIYGSNLKEIYEIKRKNIPDYGRYLRMDYDFRLNKHWMLGTGFSKSKKKSHAEPFYLRVTSQNKTIYFHTYSSVEVPMRVSYSVKNKGRFTPIVSIEMSLDIFKRLEMSIYSIYNQKIDYLSYIKEIHHYTTEPIGRIGAGIDAGVHIRIFNFLSVALLPEFKYYSNAFLIKKCPYCSDLIEGNLWSLGLRTGLIGTF